MTTTSVDPATGNLLLGGRRVFPLGLSDPPPLGSTAPDSGLDAWAEIAAAGVSFIRNYTVWQAAGLDEQLIAVAQELDAAPKHRLQLWLALAGVDADLQKQSLLDRIVNTFKDHPGLGVWKGVDEPAHGHVPASECVEVYHNDIQDGISPNSHIVEHTDLELAEPNFIDQFRDCLTRYGLTLRHSSEVELGAALAKYTNPTRT